MTLPEAVAWTETEQLGFEKETLGLYWSGHPVDRYAEALKDLNAALALKPGDGSALLERGLLRRDAGDMGGARKDMVAAQKDASVRQSAIDARATLRE